MRIIIHRRLISIFFFSLKSMFECSSASYFHIFNHTYFCEIGTKPGPPRNVSVTEVRNGFVISWQAPLERAQLVRYYVIHYKTDGIWRTLNKAQIRAEDTSYFGININLIFTD